MTGKVFFDMVVSLDGFIAPEGMDITHWDKPGYKDWSSKWSQLMSWVFPQKFFRENLNLGEGGETGAENELLQRTFERTGVSIMGANMFAAGEKGWPEEAPYHTPVFVLTHRKREPWERLGGTTFYFVNDGIENALRQARAVAGPRDIRIAGGANAVQQYLNAGLIDEFTLHYAPVFFGGGTRLFSGADSGLKAHIKQSIPSGRVTHVLYEATK